MQHHRAHLHGHTFWGAGHEGARIPKSTWVPRNTELIGVAEASDSEFIANNPGDWMFHCHMMHHTMNHMAKQVGPRIRKRQSVDRHLVNIDSRLQVDASRTPEFEVPGYPQTMMGMNMSGAFMSEIWSRKEVEGLRDFGEGGDDRFAIASG